MKLINTKKISKGFTLVELLVVIAVIGILAAVILIAMDPGEQMARGRDASRKMSIAQLGHALQNYYTSQSQFPGTADWDVQLTAKSELKSFPSYVTTGGGFIDCTVGKKSGFCYNINGTSTEVVVYGHLESKKEAATGSCGGAVASTWFVWSSAAGKAGVLCQTAEPTPGVTGLL